MISADIRKQIKRGEGEEVAFIGDPGDLEKIAATVCSFLNTRGGVVFVGVSHKGDIVGVGPDPEGLRRRLELKLQEQIAPKALFTLSIDNEEGPLIISIEVPEGRDRPYVTDGRVFVRRHSRSTPVDPFDLRQMIQSRSIEAERWERRPALSLELDDLDRAEIETTVAEASNFGRLKFGAGAGLDSALRELSLVTSGGYTNGCDVLFAQRPALRHPQCRVRFTQFGSDKAGSAYPESDWIEGPLVQVFHSLIERIGSHVRVQAYFPSGQHLRQDHFNYSIEALREGIVNALAHRDYASFAGGASISIYPNRIEIWNSGRLPREIEIKDLKKSHPSIPTNPDISHVLYLRGLMERVGRGTQKIFLACAELGARQPKWVSAESGVTLTIFSAKGAEGSRLSPRQAQILERVRPGDLVKLSDYMRDQGVSERQARRDLVELEEMGLFVRLGQARATAYQRTERTV